MSCILATIGEKKMKCYPPSASKIKPKIKIFPPLLILNNEHKKETPTYTLNIMLKINTLGIHYTLT